MEYFCILILSVSLVLDAFLFKFFITAKNNLDRKKKLKDSALHDHLMLEYKTRENLYELNLFRFQERLEHYEELIKKDIFCARDFEKVIDEWYKEAFPLYTSQTLGFDIEIYNDRRQVIFEKFQSLKKQLAIHFETLDFLAKRESDMHYLYAQIVIGAAIFASGIWIGDWGYRKSWRNDDVRIGALPFIGCGIATAGLLLIGRSVYAIWNPDHIGFY